MDTPPVLLQPLPDLLPSELHLVTQEVGDAILRYLQRGRPSLQVPTLFTTVKAPLRPLTRAAVTHIVRSALRRTGIESPINGAHVLRHSAATTMLRQGASLADVGTVLRHRSAQTTARGIIMTMNTPIITAMRICSRYCKKAVSEPISTSRASTR